MARLVLTFGAEMDGLAGNGRKIALVIGSRVKSSLRLAPRVEIFSPVSAFCH